VPPLIKYSVTSVIIVKRKLVLENPIALFFSKKSNICPNVKKSPDSKIKRPIYGPTIKRNNTCVLFPNVPSSQSRMNELYEKYNPIRP
jgi:hypothetical protein